MLDQNSTLDDIRTYFAHDTFATEAGCRIVEAEPGRAVCEMPITEHHKNARGTVMGGAVFTLADFAMAVAGNVGGTPTVSIACNIRFFAAAKGNRLIATCTANKEGRSVGFYTVHVTDELGTSVASFESTAHRS